MHRERARYAPLCAHARGLWSLVRIGAACDDTGDLRAEAAVDFGQHRGAPLVLDGVVQQGGDSLVFVAAMF